MASSIVYAKTALLSNLKSPVFWNHDSFLVGLGIGTLRSCSNGDGGIAFLKIEQTFANKVEQTNDVDGKSYLYDMVHINKKKKVTRTIPYTDQSRSGIFARAPSSNSIIFRSETDVKKKSETS